MTLKQNYLYTSLLAFAAATTLSAMVAAMMITGANTRLFEHIMPASVYQPLIVQHADGLRLVMGLDNIFLMLVASMFFFLAQSVVNERNRLIVTAVMVPILITCYLDLYENHHVMSFLVSSLQGIPITDSEIRNQYIFSLIKFHGGQLNYFLLAFFIPSQTILEKILRFGLLFLLLPITVFRFAYADLAPTDLTMFFGFAAGLFLASYIFFNRYRKEPLV